jgi:hypothetical protein
MLGRIDNFWIVIAIIIGSAIWEWIKKRAESQQTGSAPDPSAPPNSAGTPARRTTTTPPPVAAPKPSPVGHWEEELRRLLGGETPEPKPPPIAAPPIRPVVIQPAHPAPRPVSVPAAAHPVPPPPTSAHPWLAAADRTVEVELPALGEARAAHQRASHLHEEVAEHLKRVEEMAERHLFKVPTAHHQAVSAEAARTISMIRDPVTARQAMIASLVFGPPKALDSP